MGRMRIVTIAGGGATLTRRYAAALSRGEREFGIVVGVGWGAGREGDAGGVAGA